jgi:fatty acid desaturase
MEVLSQIRRSEAIGRFLACPIRLLQQMAPHEPSRHDSDQQRLVAQYNELAELAGSFIHELVHFRGQEMMHFKVGWNVLAGIPMLMPSFFYWNHIDHHSSKHYGTGQDGEYLPLGSGTWRELLHFYVQVIFLPAFVFLRFLVITPISFLHPKLRQWALERASSFVINLQYRREIPRNAPRKVWALMEWVCFARASMILIVVVLGVRGLEHIPKLYMLAIMTLGLNYVRNLVAHRYESSGQPMSHMEQLEDSVNIRGLPVITELFFPLGLRFHALHHLFPTLPYHNLRKAHQRLLAQLPEGSAYHRTVAPGFFAAARSVVLRAWRRSKPSSRAAAWYRHRTQWYEQRKLREAETQR